MAAFVVGKDPVGADFTVEEAGTLALREGAWKFILGGKRAGKDQLYNLEEDTGEQDNVIAKHPDVAAKMRKRLVAIRDAKQGIRAMK